jgi:deoxyribodipyrimidine photo-lyase
MSTAVVWFRRDLRLTDNPALGMACRAHARVICVYVHAPGEEAPWQPGAASRWWLHHSLRALDADLRRRGATLHILRGSSRVELTRLLATTGAQALYFNRLHEPASIARDRALEQVMRERGVDVHACNANLLFEPWRLRTGQGEPYRVFTPFWRNLRAHLLPAPPLSAPARIALVDAGGGLSVTALGLLPTIGWDAGLRSQWQPGERGAQALLDRFVDGALSGYRDARDVPGEDSTSRLSPHLHFGEIGPRQIVWRLLGPGRAFAERALSSREAFLRELGWREFSQHLLYHFPHSAERNLNPQFDAFAWAAADAASLERWQRGRTGIPIVDAGMRQLWRSGWMHNRVRMIVASLLTKNLRLHWLHGARWFWDTLVDADLANNTQGWQWTAGCGADAAPYFRIFNPVSQGERFDPDGVYVRHWVEELRDAPAASIHQPWRDPVLLRASGYPKPMLDLRATREAALAAYRDMRTTTADPAGYRRRVSLRV